MYVFYRNQAFAKRSAAKAPHRLANETITAVFTSMNAVNAVASQLPQVPQWEIFCTGGITKEYVIKYFGENVIVATAKMRLFLPKKLLPQNLRLKLYFFAATSG